MSALSSFAGGLGMTNADWLAVVRTLRGDLPARLRGYVSDDPRLAAQYVEVPLTDDEATAVLAAVPDESIRGGQP